MSEIELVTKHKIALGKDLLRVGLDHHGRFWIVGRDLGKAIGQRFPHIPNTYKAVTGPGPTVLAAYDIINHWNRQDKYASIMRSLGDVILNKAMPAMCEKLYGPRAVYVDDVERVLSSQGTLSELLALLPGDHHVYATLVRTAFGAPSIQRDKGPFVPHHQLVGRAFEIRPDTEISVMPLGVSSILTLLGVVAVRRELLDAKEQA